VNANGKTTLERWLKWRIEVRSEMPVVEGQRKKTIVFFLSFFFPLPRRQKDREIRSLVPFPIW